jgi:hypothetical protein
MSSFDEDMEEDVDEEKDEVEFQCFLLVLDPPLVMSSSTCLVDSTTSSKVRLGIHAIKIFNLFHNLNKNISFKNESYAWGGARTLLSLVIIHIELGNLICSCYRMTMHM